MVLVTVESSAVYAFGYDDEHQTLDVVFYRSGVYRYFDVPRNVYEDWLAAESKGHYLHQAIIGSYPYERLRPRRLPAAEIAEDGDGDQPFAEERETLPPSESLGDHPGDNRTVEENTVP